MAHVPSLQRNSGGLHVLLDWFLLATPPMPVVSLSRVASSRLACIRCLAAGAVGMPTRWAYSCRNRCIVKWTGITWKYWFYTIHWHVHTLFDCCENYVCHIRSERHGNNSVHGSEGALERAKISRPPCEISRRRSVTMLCDKSFAFAASGSGSMILN